jgi:hypothetical protein
MARRTRTTKKRRGGGQCGMVGGKRRRTMKGGMYGFSGEVIAPGTLAAKAAYTGPVNSAGGAILQVDTRVSVVVALARAARGARVPRRPARCAEGLDLSRWEPLDILLKEREWRDSQITASTLPRGTHFKSCHSIGVHIG